jgi:hypothetical protein
VGVLFRRGRRLVGFALGLILVVYLFNAISSINQDESETLIMFSQLQIRLLEFGGFMFIVWLALSFASLYFALEGVAPIMLVNVFCLIIWVVWVVIIVSVYQSAMQVSFEIALPQSLQGFLSLTVAFGIPMFNGFEIMYSLME